MLGVTELKLTSMPFFMCFLSYVRLDVNNLLSRCSCHVGNLVHVLKCLYVMHLMLPFFTFIHLHLVSHLGTLDEPRKESKHVMLESNQKTVLVDKPRRWCLWWTYPEDGRTPRVHA